MELCRPVITSLNWSECDTFAGVLLTPEDFGLVAMIAVFLALGASLIDLVFKQAIIRLKEATKLDFNTAFFMPILRLTLGNGLLWPVVNPLWEGLRSLGFEKALLNPSFATNDSKIQRTLNQWHQYLEPNQIWQMYQSRLQMAHNLILEEQLKQYIHGNRFIKK